jgi:hypothetical protein
MASIQIILRLKDSGEFSQEVFVLETFLGDSYMKASIPLLSKLLS